MSAVVCKHLCLKAKHVDCSKILSPISAAARLFLQALWMRFVPLPAITGTAFL